MAIARTFVRAICTSAYMAKRIADNRYFIPSVKYNATPANRDFAKIADRYWLYSLFNFQFLYWPQHHLLGVVMEDDKDLLKAWPNGQAEVVSVFFQDGNDRNYDFEEWPETIEFFQERTERYRPIASMPKKQALAALCWMARLIRPASCSMKKSMRDGQWTISSKQLSMTRCLKT